MKSIMTTASTDRTVVCPCTRKHQVRTGRACAALQQHQGSAAPRITRRGLTLSVPLLLLANRDARADKVIVSTSQQQVQAAVPSSSGSGSQTGTSSQLETFLDAEYELQYPSNWVYKDIPIPRVERGPQPERSPVLARFEAPDAEPGSISVVTRKAQAFKQTILQVSDISQLGNQVDVAKLILPRGSTLLATSKQESEQPSRETPFGELQLPPQTYYIYEFTTSTGLHVAMAAAAKRGNIFICGASTTAEQWQIVGPVLRGVVKSFRLRSQPTIS